MGKSSLHFIAGAAFIVISSTSVGTVITSTAAFATTEYSSPSNSLNYAHNPISVKSFQLAANSTGGFHPIRTIGSIIRGAIHTVGSVVKSVVHTAASIISRPLKAISSVIHTVGSAINTVSSVVSPLIATAVSEFLPVFPENVESVINAVTHPFQTLTHPIADLKWLLGEPSYTLDLNQKGSPELDDNGRPIYLKTRGLTLASQPNILDYFLGNQQETARLDYFNIYGLLNVPVPFINHPFNYYSTSLGYDGSREQGQASFGILDDISDIVTKVSTGVVDAVKGAIQLGSHLVKRVLGNSSEDSPASKAVTPAQQLSVVPSILNNLPTTAAQPTRITPEQENIVPPVVSLLH